jgi:hypothetical protein
MIPPPELRGGGLGATTYGEWAYTTGALQTLIFRHRPGRPLRMLDGGCGVGRLYLAARRYLIGGTSPSPTPKPLLCRQGHRRPEALADRGRRAQLRHRALGLDPPARRGLALLPGLKVAHTYPGQWKDQPGLTFQDVVVFETR